LYPIALPSHSSHLLIAIDDRKIFFFPIFAFSDLYPVSSHFFCITAVDKAKPYVPVTTALLDIPTAWVFFGANPAGTLLKLQTILKKMIAEWNEEHRGKTSVSLTLHFI